MNKSIKYSIFFLIAGLMLAACNSTSSQSGKESEPSAQENNSSAGVTASGVVAPAQYGTLSLPVSGIVAEVFVKEGDQVEAGQVLLRLRGSEPDNLDEDLQARIAAAQFELESAQKALSDLEKSAQLARDEALRQAAQTALQVRDTQYLLDGLSIPANQESMDSFEAFDEMKAKYDQARAAFEEVEELDSGNDLRQEREDALEAAQSDLNSAMRRLQLTIDLQVAQSNLAIVRQDAALYQEGPDPADVALAQSRLANAEAALVAAQAVTADLELVAPYSGTVTDLLTTPGEFVAPGTPLVQLADLSSLQIETTDLDEAGAAQLEPGAPVEVSFDALPGVVIPGKIVFIPPKAIEGGNGDFAVVVSLDELPELLRWGMSAFVDFQP